MHYIQINITLNESQIDFVKANVKKMKVGELAKAIGVTYNKLHNNLKLLGYVETRKPVINQAEGFFNIDEFSKYYNY